MTEGTYPVRAGGVSTWCDQLLRGLPEHDWAVVGLTATGTERPVWATPPSVSSVVLHPMWGPQPSPPRRRRDARAEVQEVLHQFWDAALAQDGTAAVDRARAALHRLVRLAGVTSMASLLAARGSTGPLLTAWRHHCADLPPMSVADAVAAANLVDRTLAAVDAPLGEVDLVHAAGNGAAALVALAARWRTGIPMVMSEHGVYLRERYLALDDGDRSWAERRAVTAAVRRICEVAYAEADRVLPVSNFNRRWAEYLGADPDKVVTIPNGVPPEVFEPVGEEPALPTLSFVGRIDPLKDLHTLVRAFALVQAQVPAARLRIFGPVPEGNEAYRDSVAALAADLGVESAVSFEGPTAGSRPAIAAGSLVVLSSISEGLPFTVIEAMMCGRATVSTDVGGVAECLDAERRAGVVVPSRDPQAFADACVQLLTDDDRRRDMAAAARRHALANATLDRVLEDYRAAYRCVSGGVSAEPARSLRTADRNFVASHEPVVPPAPRTPAETLVGGAQ